MTRSWIALGGLFALTLIARCGGCEDRIMWPPPRAAIAWDGTQYVTAWRRDKVLYLQREGERPKAVYTHRDQHGHPMLHATSEGFVVVTSLDGRGDVDRSEVVVTLDTNGRKLTKPKTRADAFSPDVRCVSRSTRGGAIATAFVTASDPPWEDVSVLTVHTYDANGAAVASALFVEGSSPHNCAVASDGSQIAVAVYTREELSVYILDAAEPRDVLFHIELPAHFPGPMWQTAVARDPDGTWAVLYRHPTAPGAYRVLHVDERGIVGTTQLPDELWSRELDLGSNARGLYVAWIGGYNDALHVRGISGRSQETRTIPQNGGFRVTSDDGTDCVVAVMPQSGAVLVEKFPSCP